MDISPITNFPKLSSLSLSANQSTDITPIASLNGLYYFFVERNNIKDITPLFNAARKDSEGEQPYINIFMKGNPLSRTVKRQLSQMKELGCRINN